MTSGIVQEVVFGAGLLASGLLLSEAIIGSRRPLERVAFTLLFGAAAIPYVLVAIAMVASVRLSTPLVVAVSISVTAAAAAAFWRLRSRAVRPSPAATSEAPATPRAEAMILGVALLVAVGAAFYYSDRGMLHSLATYIGANHGKCFDVASLRLIDASNIGGAFNSLRDVYVVSTTPGNAVFVAPYMSAYGLAGARAAYVLVQVLTYLFVALLALRWTRRAWIALAAGLFAIAGPYALSIEVLDRNAIAFALTAGLVYALAIRPRSPLLHGWLYGVAAGTGLRFLPLLNVFFVLAAYREDRARARRYLWFGLVGALVFAFNVPHLLFQGFHSKDESLSLFTLAWLAITKGTRFPFQPLPTGPQCIVQALTHMGALVAGLVLVGIVAGWRSFRRETRSLVLVGVTTLAILAVQRDWIQQDKARILLSAWLPIPLFFALGLARLTTAGARKGAWVLLATGITAAFLTDGGLRRLQAPADPSALSRHPLVPSETYAFAQFFREHLPPLGLLPGYGGLGDKLDLRRKRILEKATAANLAPTVASAPVEPNGWVARAFDPTPPPPPAAPPSADILGVRIDLEALVTNPGQAVTPAPEGAEPFLDLSAREALLDVAYKASRVSWQPQPLTVTAFPRRLGQESLNEIVLHLNTYTSLGRDTDGFERVNTVQYDHSAPMRVEGRRTGLRALPPTDDRAEVVLRVPRDTRIVIQSTVVDETKGSPYRVDSWLAIAGAPSDAAIAFRAGEPESYQCGPGRPGSPRGDMPARPDAPGMNP